MKTLIQKVREKLRKKSFWLPENIAKKVEQEAKDKTKWKSESTLITHIVKNWFEK